MAPKQTDETKKVAIQELRDKISSDVSDDYIKSDGYLLTWLEDKKYKVEKAEKAIRTSLVWRKENKIDTILQETFDDSWIPSKFEFIGHDKGGRPILLADAKYAEVTEEMLNEAMEKALKDKDATLRYSFYIAEKVGRAIQEASKKANTPINSITALCDMKSIKFTDYTKYVTKVIPLMRESQKIAEENYPGIVHELLIFNAPKKAMRIVLTMLRPVIGSDLVDKIHVYGRKSEKWIPKLLERIDAEALPVRFGGTKKDGEMDSVYL